MRKINKISMLPWIVLLAIFSCGSAKACDGHFETHTETVCVSAAHYERVWVAPAYRCGLLVRGGYFADIYCPPRYEYRYVRVWVPDSYGGGSFNLGINWKWRVW